MVRRFMKFKRLQELAMGAPRKIIIDTDPGQDDAVAGPFGDQPLQRVRPGMHRQVPGAVIERTDQGEKRRHHQEARRVDAHDVQGVDLLADFHRAQPGGQGRARPAGCTDAPAGR